MGYYTDHTLYVKNVESHAQFDELVNALQEMEIYDYAVTGNDYDAYKKSVTFYCCDSVKWYNHDDDMKRISIQFPDMTFMIEGHGEEFGDLWRCYYKNGEQEFCRGEIFFEEPDEIIWEDTDD